jgi:hypothetical protein
MRMFLSGEKWIHIDIGRFWYKAAPWKVVTTPTYLKNILLVKTCDI